MNGGHNVAPPLPRHTGTAALMGAGFVLITILVVSRGNVDRMTTSDGLIVRYVASHLTTAKAEIHPVVATRGTSLRYARIGLPAMLWLTSAGREEAMPYAQPLLMVLSGAAIAAAVRTLMPALPRPAELAVFAAVGLTLSLAGGYSEGFSVALALWALAFGLRERWSLAALMFALALLTRENAITILAGTIIWFGLRHHWRGIAIMSTALVPMAVWHAIVANRYGGIPLLHPYLRTDTSTVGPPISSLWRSLTRTPPESVVTVSVHILLGIIALLLWRRSVFGTAAAVASLQVLVAGPFAWHYVGHAVRTFSFLQVFTLLALVPVILRPPKAAGCPTRALAESA